MRSGIDKFNEKLFNTSNMKNNLFGASIRVASYKSFFEASGFDEVLPINLVIGRNNSGKSALLDAVEFLIEPKPEFETKNHMKIYDSKVLLTQKLTEKEIGVVFPRNQGGAMPRPGSDYEYGKEWIGKPITVAFKYDHSGSNNPPQKKAYSSSEPEFDDTMSVKNRVNQLIGEIEYIHTGLVLRRVSADRDILHEGYSNSLSLSQDGNGATNLIHNYLHHSQRNIKIIETELLDALNKIFEPQSSFVRILTRIRSDETNEVFLEEEDKGLIPLSSSGSGLKTVILILLSTIAIPDLENTPLSEYVFIFEEIENNLHPAIQRNLMKYIRDMALKSGATVFISTHSNVLIDASSGDKNSQIVHVTHNGSSSKAKLVATSVDRGGILDDLDVKASDLLQANCVIWVEGPSDRILLNKWLSVAYPGRYVEGYHYSIMFYGGRLLAHLEIAKDEEETEIINLLKINRKASILIDSDKNKLSDDINDTKQRIRDEIFESGGISWVTAGREIENYLNNIVIAKYLGKKTTSIKQFQKFEDYIKSRDSKTYALFKRSKSLFAEKISEVINDKSDLKILDLEARLEEMAGFIDRSNSTAE